MTQLKLLFIVLIVSINGLAQQQITGHVQKPGSGKPLAGVSVTVINKNTETNTDSSGNFQISAAISDTLYFRLVEYQSRQVPIDHGAKIVVNLQPSTPIYSFVDEPAEFHGGFNKFVEYVSHGLRHHKNDRRHGKIFVYFAIDTMGQIMPEETAIIRAINERTDEETHKLYDREVVRVVNNSPTWIPARIRDKKVRFAMSLPISF